jgi:hypothetical protein
MAGQVPASPQRRKHTNNQGLLGNGTRPRRRRACGPFNGLLRGLCDRWPGVITRCFPGAAGAAGAAETGQGTR